MNSIGEIQSEIKEIQKELCKLDNRLQMINDELSSFKDVTYEDSIYQKIYDIANSMQIIHHPIVDQNQAVKGNYFAILISVAGLGDTINNDQLLFLQRMILADKEKNRLDCYSNLSNKIEERDIIYKFNSSIKTELANQLLLDLMLITELSKARTRGQFETLTDLASIMNIDLATMKLIAEVSIIILEQNIKKDWNYESILLSDQLFGYYLGGIDGWANLVRGAVVEKEKEEKIIHDRLVSALTGLERNAYERHGENWFYYED